MTKRIAAAAALAAALLAAKPAHAILMDHGPQDPALVFPIWYRDLNGLALKQCLSQTLSPNGGAGAMCFPLNPDPAGFAGNVGPEIFYNDLNVLVQKGNASFSLRYLAALEATYLPLGQPVHGTETVFARIRIVISTQTPGVYTVTHPFGVEVFNVRPFEVGPRAVFFTTDMPLGPAMDFDSALNGRVGPFMQWDFVDAGWTLDVRNAAGATESFVGDPNIAHSFTGSPFGTNFVRVDGPAGSNLDGVGGTTLLQPLGNVLGQKWTAPIPTPLTIKRATYSRDPVKNVVGIDVYAKSAPANEMILSAPGIPNVEMAGDASGNYFAHVEMPATQIPPAAVTVTNVTSVPVNSVTQALVDLVNITTATFDTMTRTLRVVAASSDLSVPAPAMAVAGPLGGAASASGEYKTILAAGVLPPARVSVLSSAGGTDSDDVAILPGLTDAKPFPPVAVADAVTTTSGTVTAIPVTANDAVSPPATVRGVYVIGAPANGTATGGAGGTITYTSNAGYSGADSFSYVVVDTAGAVSNLATVTVTVNFLAAPPTANGDDFALLQNKSGAPSSRTYNVLANDLAAAGTTLNPASIVIVARPLHGNAVANANGTITYTPVLNYSGADSFTYTVANSAGVVSAPAAVNVVVEGGPESVSIAKAQFVVSKQAWTIVGSTNWFGPTLLSTKVTCYVGRGTTGPSLGTAAVVDQFGKFQLVPPPLTAPAPDATNTFTCQTTNGGIVTAVVALK